MTKRELFSNHKWHASRHVVNEVWAFSSQVLSLVMCTGEEQDWKKNSIWSKLSVEKLKYIAGLEGHSIYVLN